jgi:hypothetical protein
MSRKSTVDNFTGDDSSYDYDYQPYKKEDNVKLNPSKVNSGTLDDASLKLRAEELSRREADLARREQQLGPIDPDAPIEPVVEVDKPNWPICRPVLSHKIRKLKSHFFKAMAVMGYLGWFFIMAALLLNHIGAWVSIFAPIAQPPNGITTTIEKVRFVVISALYIPFFVPIHFALCYWPLYATLRSPHIFRFIIFFVTYGFNILFLLFCLSGYYEYGPCGIFLMILYIPPGGGWLGCITSLVMCIVWAFLIIYFLVIYIMMLVAFRKEYGSMRDAGKKLKDEALSGVQKGVKGAVEFGVKTAVDQALKKGAGDAIN